MKRHYDAQFEERLGQQPPILSHGLTRAKCWLAACSCVLMLAGCSAESASDKPATAQADVSSKERQSPTAPAAGELPNTPPRETVDAANPRDVALPSENGGKTAAPLKSTVAPPSAEQIARWTTAPFEPLQLLAIREWDKSSFTRRLAPTPDGKHFIAAGSRVLLWSIANDKPVHTFFEPTPDDQDQEILALAVSPDGRWFAAGDSQGMLRVWGLDDRREIAAKKLGATGIQYLAISPDSREIATFSYDNQISTWTADTLAQQKAFKVDTNGLERIEYMAPHMLAAAGESTSLWNTSTGQLVQKLSPGRHSFALARSPDAARFIFGGDESLHIWNIAEGKLEAEIKHEVSGRERLAFSPDGKFLATTTGRSVQLWNLAERRAVQIIDSFGWPIVDLSWLPGSNLLAIASDIGCTRIWGTSTDGATQGLKPLHAPVSLPDAASKEPATIAQMEQLIDLRTFPRLPGSEPNDVSQDSFGCVAPATADEAKSFYRYFLEKDGWELAKAPSANPAAMEFRKNGFRLTLACYDAGDGKTNVMLHRGGNYDLRSTPKFDAAPIQKVYESENTVSYRTKADLVQIESWLLRKLHAAGWTGFAQANSSSSEEPDRRDLSFLRNGTTLRISIGKFPVDPTSYTVQYTLFSNDCAAPVPPDSGFVEFDGSTEPALIATTKMTLDEARKFYDDEMLAQGWLLRPRGQSSQDDRVWLSYLRGQCDMTVGLTRLPDGRTLVEIGRAVESLWEQSQAKKAPAVESDAVGLEAADFPAVDSSQPAKFDAVEKSIEVVLEKTTLADAAQRFTEKLTALGWTAEKGGIRSEDYTFFDFEKDDKEISLRARMQNGNAVVSFEGDGLLWTKDLPGPKQTVSFERWLRLNKHPAGLELLDKYESEMRAIKPQAEKAANG